MTSAEGFLQIGQSGSTFAQSEHVSSKAIALEGDCKDVQAPASDVKEKVS